MSSDTKYYRARALEERDRAAAASEPSIANIHLEMAIKYEALAQSSIEQLTRPESWSSASAASPA